MDEKGGFLVELGSVPSAILQRLEDEFPTFVPVQDLAQFAGIPEAQVHKVIRALGALERTLIFEESSAVGGEVSYGIKRVNELEESRVPFGGRFSEKEVVTVPVPGPERVVEVPGPERVVEKLVPEPIVVGSAIPAPQLVPGRKNTSARKAPAVVHKGAASDRDLEKLWVWPDNPGPAERVKGFIDPVWFSRMDYMVSHGSHISLEGPVSTGKSTAWRELAARYSKPLVSISCDGGLQRREIQGTMHAEEGRTYNYASRYAAACVSGWFACFNEANSANPNDLMFLNAQLAEPYIVYLFGHDFPIHPDFRCCITWNKGLIGTRPLPQSLLDRFFPIEVGYPDDTMLTKLLILHGASTMSLVERLVKVCRALWQTNLTWQLSLRRIYDALMIIGATQTPSETPVVAEALLSAIMPTVPVTERVQVANIISQTLG